MSAIMEAGDRVRMLVERRDMAGLGHALFGLRAVSVYDGLGSWTPAQREIAALFAFIEHKRAAVSAHTRMGKTFSAGLGLAALTITDPRPLKVAVIGPREEQARLIRTEYVEALTRNPLGRRLLGVGNRRLDDRMRRELSRKKLDFRDGKRLRVMSTGPDGEGLMGEGADIVVVDECDLVPELAWPKILRMLGDNPADSVLILLGNPWNRGGRFHKALSDPAYKVIQVNYKRGIVEGRTTQAFVDEQRADLPPALFQVFWESVFPDAAEGQLLSWQWIDRAIQSPTPADEGEWSSQRVVGAGTRYGLDVAEGGTDFSVLTRAVYRPGRRRVTAQWDWHVADTMETADRAAHLMPPGSEVRVDANGVGKGVADRLRALGFIVLEFKAAEKAYAPERFRDRKAESWWEIRDSLERGEIELADLTRLKNDLPRMTWKLQAGRIVVEQLDGKSPDWGDSAHLALMEAANAPPASVIRRPQRWAPESGKRNRR